MATIKSFTDPPWSKKLAEILPIGSADMCYPLPYEDGDNPLLERGGFGSTPCWSLSALLGVLPQSVRLVGTPKDSYWYCECVDGNNQWYAGFGSAENPVDACVAMIEKLHEQNLL